MRIRLDNPIPTASESWAELDQIRPALLRWWFHARRVLVWREPDASNYVRIVSELLLQRTTASAVNSLLPTIIDRYPSWRELASAPVADLEVMLQPLGLWRRRARSVKSLATLVAEREEAWPADREELERLPGVGQYIASAILLLVHGQREPLLDTNMARVLERLFGPRHLADIRHDPYLQSLSRELLAKEDPVALNWAILDLAALVCRPRNPRCSDCPLLSWCQSAPT